MAGRTFIFCGSSGDGKSYLLSHLCENLMNGSKLAQRSEKSPLYVFNGQSDEYPSPDFNKLESLEDALSLKKSIIICEDLVLPSTKTVSTLRELLDYSARHNELYIVIIAHTLIKNGIYSILPSIGHIVFTKSPGLKRSFNAITRDFSVPLDENLWDNFIRCQSKFCYLALNLRKRQVLKISDNPDEVCDVLLNGNTKEISQDVSYGLEEKRGYIRKMSGLFGQDKQIYMSALFDIFFANKEEVKCLSEDCVISLENKCGESIKCNVVDMLWYATTYQETPPFDVIILFRKLIANKNIPKVLIKNPILVKYL